jgi:hypothetical protein
MEKFITAFREIAERLNTLKPDPKATYFLECLSGGLIWTDERPPFDVNAEELGALRMLWNYRTSVLVGKPRAEFRELWDLAVAVAPRWPAFRPERFTPSPELVDFIEKRKKASDRSIERLDAWSTGHWKPLSGTKADG